LDGGGRGGYSLNSIADEVISSPKLILRQMPLEALEEPI
jgi:hypothetical protein